MNKKQAFIERFGETIPLKEKSNLAEWLESRLHLALTQIADDLFGGGNVTRVERIALSGAIGEALDAYHQYLQENAPQLFSRRPWEDAPEEDQNQVSEAAVQLREAGNGSQYMPLIEKAVRRDGTIPIKIIQPGWGSSGYYPAEVLERDGPQIFRRGLKMYWNHQTAMEEVERPEGDLRDLAAELISDARWDKSGPKGPGLYADAKVFEAYQPAVDDLAGHIGVSIRALGRAQHGKIEGREGAIITELTGSKSIDFVTEPGAGGEILQLFEAARPGHADLKPPSANDGTKHATREGVAKPKINKEVDMDELEKLQEANATLENKLSEAQATIARQGEQLARLSEALTLREAKDMVQEALQFVQIPGTTKARLVANLAGNPPVKDGVLDKEAFKTRIDEAVKAEVKYLSETLGLGQIKGLGEANGDSDDGDEQGVEEALEGAFSDLGLNESAVKIAAKGRD